MLLLVAIATSVILQLVEIIAGDKAGKIADGVDLLVFDFGVNAGPGGSARGLQDLLGVHQDGSIGPVTTNGFDTCAVDEVIRNSSATCLNYHRSLSDLPTFGAGWTNRAHGMLEAHLRMASHPWLQPRFQVHVR